MTFYQNKVAAALLLMLAVGFFGSIYIKTIGARAALHEVYGEFVTGISKSPGSSKHCPIGRSETAFLARDGRTAREVTGYVCTGYFGKATIMEQELEPGDRLRWR